MFWIGLIVGVVISFFVWIIWYNRVLKNDVRTLDLAINGMETQSKMIDMLSERLDKQSIDK